MFLLVKLLLYFRPMGIWGQWLLHLMPPVTMCKRANQSLLVWSVKIMNHHLSIWAGTSMCWNCWPAEVRLVGMLWKSPLSPLGSARLVVMITTQKPWVSSPDVWRLFFAFTQLLFGHHTSSQFKSRVVKFCFLHRSPVLLHPRLSAPRLHLLSDRRPC